MRLHIAPDLHAGYLECRRWRPPDWWLASAETWRELGWPDPL